MTVYKNTIQYLRYYFAEQNYHILKLVCWSVYTYCSKNEIYYSSPRDIFIKTETKTYTMLIDFV